MIKLPKSLPIPSQDYSVSIQNAAIRTRMESGRTRQRRRFTASVNEIAVKWEFTDEEFQLFESFLFHVLDGGTSWFETKLLTGGGVVVHKARIQEGSYSASYNAAMQWSVTAKLDVEIINRLDKAYVDLLISINPNDLPGVFDALDSLSNTKLPELGE